MTNLKECRQCFRHLPLSKFHTHKLSHDGHTRYCKDCTLFAMRKSSMKRFNVDITPRPDKSRHDPRLNFHNAEMIRLASIRFPTTMECYDIKTGEVGSAHFYEGNGLNINMANRGWSWSFAGPLTQSNVIEFFCAVLRDNHIRLEGDSLSRYESMTQIYGFVVTK